MKTKIEWTDQTDNIIVGAHGGWRCLKCSPGCDHCYAEAINRNPFFGGNGKPFTHSLSATNVTLKVGILDGWARQKKGRRHFVSSMTDVFGTWVPQSWIFKFLDAMAAAPSQTFQVLTKRAIYMAYHVEAWLNERGWDRIPPNIWIGFTAENQECFNARWQRVEPLVHRLGVVFVSAEPLLGALQLPEEFLALKWRAQVIVGGESGKEARPMHPQWARDLRDQCDAAEVCFFFKQWGEWITNPDPHPEWPLTNIEIEGKNYGPDSFLRWDGYLSVRIGKKAAGRILDDCDWHQMPYAHDICRVCGCTVFHACPSICYWIDSDRTLCSECDPRTRTQPVAGLGGKVGAL